jgi:hypothetical protein
VNGITRNTAIHEAAHAVAAIRAGLVFDQVSALPDETLELDGALYWTELQESGELAMAPELLAVVSLAGACAEAKLRGVRFDRMFQGVGATEDRESVASLGLTEQQFIAACHETVAMVDRDWELIERIADELEAGNQLSFDDVDAIVTAADGEETR